jgi:hypothetical protein
MGKHDAAETHQPLQAVVMADSFTQPFRPITIQRPKVRWLSPAAQAIGLGCSASAADEHGARVPAQQLNSTDLCDGGLSVVGTSAVGGAAMDLSLPQGALRSMT